MLANIEAGPQVLFAWHLYCPASDLLMFVMFNQFPSMIVSPPTFDQVTVGSGYPDASQDKDVLLPSSTILFSIGFTDTGTAKEKQNIQPL